MSCLLTWHKTFPLIYYNAAQLNLFGPAAVIDLERSAQICLRLSRNERQKKRPEELISALRDLAWLERSVAIASTRSFARGLHNSFTLGICSQDRSIEIARLADASRFQADSVRQALDHTLLLQSTRNASTYSQGQSCRNLANR